MHHFKLPTHIRRAIASTFMLLLCAGLATAADPQAAEFRKLAKQAGKDIFTLSKDGPKTVLVELKQLAKDYADGTTDVAPVMAAAVDSMTEQRHLLETGTRDALEQLSLAGSGILDTAVQNGLPTNPGPDFVAGSGGTWDDALVAAQKALDKADEKFDKAFVKFMLLMQKGAKKLGRVIDIHARVPAHGEGFWHVLPPALQEAPVDGALDAHNVPHVFVATRFVETTISDTLGLGILWRQADGMLDILGGQNSTESETLAEDVQSGEEDYLSLSINPTLSGDSFLRLVIVPQISAERRISLSLGIPSLTSATAANALGQFKKDAKKELGLFGNVGGQVTKYFKKQLKSHAKAQASGQASTVVALDTGACNRRTARGDINFWQHATARQPMSNAIPALQKDGVNQAEIPGDFQVTACGFFANLTKKWQKKHAQRQAQISKAYEQFVTKVLKRAAKDGETIGFSQVSRPHRIEGPMITVSNDPPEDTVAHSAVTDAFVMVDGSATDGNVTSGFVSGITQPELGVQEVSTTVTVNDGSTVVIGGLLTDSGGANKTAIPGLGDIPTLGWLFRKGRSETEQTTLLILMRPAVVEDPGL